MLAPLSFASRSIRRPYHQSNLPDPTGSVGRRAPESEAVWQYAENDRGTTAAGRLSSQERCPNRILRSHPLGACVPSEAAWRREADQKRHREQPERLAMPSKVALALQS